MSNRSYGPWLPTMVNWIDINTVDENTVDELILTTQ